MPSIHRRKRGLGSWRGVGVATGSAPRGTEATVCGSSTLQAWARALRASRCYRAMAELADHLQGPTRFPRFEQRPNFRNAQAGQALTQAAGRVIGNAHLLGRNQVIPGGRQVFVVEMPLPTLHESLGDLLQQIP